jgi:hypothetical protein
MRVCRSRRGIPVVLGVMNAWWLFGARDSLCEDDLPGPGGFDSPSRAWRMSELEIISSAFWRAPLS